MADAERDSKETDRPIPLHRVLVEEHNHQFPESPIDLAEIEALRPYWTQLAADVADPEEREKAVGSRLVGEFYRRLHASGVARTALCFSGGGIRSATFGLGIVQGLARLGLLTKFDFLSTVSGGGYLGSWLSGWIQRSGGRVADVEKELASPPASPLEPEPVPVRHLRQYSRYMSPRVGLLSADTWTLVAIFFRNLLLNWLVLLPLLAAALMTPRLGVILARETKYDRPEWLQPSVFLFGFLAGVLAIAYIASNRPSLLALETGPPGPIARRLRTQGGFLWLCLLPLAAMSIASTLFWAWTGPGSAAELDALRFAPFGVSLSALTAFVLFGAFLHLGGFLVSLFFRRGFQRWKELLAVVATGALGGLFAFGAARFAAGRLTPVSHSDLHLLIYVCCAGPILLFLFLAAATLFVGLASKLMSDEDREWLARAGAWILIWVFGRLTLTALVFFGPLAWHSLAEIVGQKAMAAVGGISGLITLILGFSPKSNSGSKNGGEPSKGSVASDLALSVAAPLFALSILVGLSALTSVLLRALAGSDLAGQAGLPKSGLLEVIAHAPSALSGWVALGLLGLGAFFGLCVDINRFSLHAAYRDRLIRAYLGASRRPGERKPNPFTGFDEKDNLELRELRANRPFHLVNVALNLVHGQALAVQDRKAESFTFSALHCGYRGGYRPAESYGRHDDERRLSLGTAVAISGAAASPNMGYHSSPVITFLLAVFNVRLGWWLGNPGPAGASTYPTPGPRFAPAPLFAEAFGLTDDQSSYVYLSDGGHFENLGLYEMVIRRCRYIVVSDAGADGDFTFEDLGNALSKIRIDLGVPIEFDQGLPMRARPDLRGKSYDPTSSRAAFPYFAVARIRYSCVDPLPADGAIDEEARDRIDGWLLYVKPSLNDTEPADVFHYAKLHPTFPHESTGNQLYTEQQFECYRMLGSHVVDSLTRGPVEDLAELFEIARGAATPAPVDAAPRGGLAGR